MAKYKYAAVGPDGETIRGIEEAESLVYARLALIERDLRPVELKEKAKFFSMEVRGRKVPRKELMHFSRQLAVFIRAGIPIIEGLEVIAEDVGNKRFKAALTVMADALRSGSTFTEAAEAHPYAFPPFYLGILRSAELTGNLDTVLEQLSEYIERDAEARGKIVGALIYPLVVTVMAVVSVAVMAIYVLPKFKTFFNELDADLPLPTRMIMGGADFVGQWGLVMFAVVAIIAMGIAGGLRSERGKVARDTLLLRLPVLGDIVRHAVLERFCRILSSMVAAGVPLPDALAVTSDATNNRVYRQGLAVARESMMRGEGLAAPLSATGLFPAAARQMFRVGENTGSLDKQMATAAAYFDRELDYKLKRFTSLFEPAVILVAGGMVGFIAIALVSAMYGIFRQVNM